MSNFRPASMDDEDDNENEDSPLLRRTPYQQLHQHSRLVELLPLLFGARLQFATTMLLLGLGRLRMFGAFIPL